MNKNLTLKLIVLAVIAISLSFTNILKAQDCVTCDIRYWQEGDDCYISGDICLPYDDNNDGPLYIFYAYDIGVSPIQWYQWLLWNNGLCEEGCTEYVFSKQVPCAPTLYYYFANSDSMFARMYCGYPWYPSEVYIPQ
jgi:hypothetical protein